MAFRSNSFVTKNYVLLLLIAQEGDIWSQIWPTIVKSPIAIIAFVITYLMGYGIAYMLFRHKRSMTGWKYLPHFLGCGYTALVFIVLNIRLFLNGISNITIDEVTNAALGTLIISFAIEFIVFVVVTVMRDRNKG